MPRKHKKVLRKNITLIMCALIGTIVVVYGVGMILWIIKVVEGLPNLLRVFREGFA